MQPATLSSCNVLPTVDLFFLSSAVLPRAVPLPSLPIEEDRAAAMAEELHLD